ncbi:MAG: chromate transporter [Eubacteriales bacterium]|jgi:chromate transporter|nr:chromate transporter [Eubacteriales bacterium]
MTLLILFWEFFQTGLFAIGGGLATLPFLQKILERYPDWFGSLHVADVVAIAESTPGPIAVNAASFAGYYAAGVPGALAATFAVVLPSFIIASLVSRALEQYRNSRLIQSAFGALRPTVAGLIAAAGWVVLRTALFSAEIGAGGLLAAIEWKSVALFAVLLVLLHLPKVKSIHPVVYIIAGGAAGLLLGL